MRKKTNITDGIKEKAAGFFYALGPSPDRRQCLPQGLFLSNAGMELTNHKGTGRHIACFILTPKGQEERDE